MKTLLITGTDTGVGKTLVTALLVRHLKERGVNVDVVKPIETGCKVGPTGDFVASDALLLAQALNVPETPSDRHVFYCFENPVAPLVAARLENRAIDPAIIEHRLKERAANCDLLIVEGAGGVMVPLAENYTYVNLARECAMKVVVVVGSRLGAGNHSALTFELRKGKGISLIGYVFNDLHSDKLAEDASIATNRELVREIGGLYGLAELGYLPKFDLQNQDSLWSYVNHPEVAKMADNLIKALSLGTP